MAEEGKIKLQAIFTKDGRFTITDQHGREFDYVDSRHLSMNPNLVWLSSFELEAPWRLGIDRSRINLTFSIPLRSEGEMPAFIQEMIRERAAEGF